MPATTPSRPSTELDPDFLGERTQFLKIGMIAVAASCAGFAIMRAYAEWASGLSTPWRFNAVGAVAVFSLHLWVRRAPERRARAALNVTAFVAIGCLLAAVPYGMTSSKWWISLVGFSVLLMGRRFEAMLWTAVTLVALPTVSIAEPYIQIPGSLGESRAEQLASAIAFLGILMGITWAFRVVAQRRAEDLSASATSLVEAMTELESTRDEALSASAAKSRFVAMTSHELRGPLNGIVGMSHALSDTQLSPAQQDLVGTLGASATTLGNLLQDLLDLARIEAGELDVISHPYEPRELIADVADQFSPLASGKRVELAALSEASVPQAIVGDVGRVRQVLANLVGNAVKFTAAGSISLRAGVTAGRVEYEVRDTGRGMSPDALARIFAPFHQASDELTDRRAGTGLGLWIARAITQAMGGELVAESTPGAGSRFVVRLPFDEAPFEPPASLDSIPSLLVVTGTPLSAAAFLSVARDVGATFRIPSSQEEAFARDVPSPEVVVLDIDHAHDEQLLPRLQLRYPRAGVVLCASMSRLARAEMLASKASAEVMMKPVRARRLAAALVRATGSRVAPVGPSASQPPDVEGTVLVVDDDPINRKVARFAAQQMGLRVDEAASGEDALVRLSEATYDVLLLDMHLEGMDGVETAKAVFGRFAARERPSIVAYTGSVQPEDRRRCLENGMEEVLSKPLDRAAFTAAMTRAIAARRRRRGRSDTLGGMPSFDQGAYDELVNSLGPPGVREILDMFLSTLESRVAAVSSACRGRDRSALEFAAHTLVATAATFGLAKLSWVLGRIERAAPTEAWTTLDDMVEEARRRRVEGEAILRSLPVPHT